MVRKAKASATKRVLREATRSTWTAWRARAIGLELYSVGATGLFFAWVQGHEQFWTAAYQSVAAGAAALLLLMSCIFLEELGKAPATLRNRRLEPASFVAHLTVRNDQIHQNVMELDREIAAYEQYRKVIGHGAVNDGLADTALAKLNARIEQFGAYVANATFEDGNWRRRRAARRIYKDIRLISHVTDLGIVREALGRLKKTW
jgi:hypothetical protein